MIAQASVQVALVINGGISASAEMMSSLQQVVWSGHVTKGDIPAV